MMLSKASPLSTQILPLLTAHENQSSLRRKVRALARTAAVLVLVQFFGVTLPVMAEAPSEASPASSNFSFSSDHWMQIQINGKDAGYAPVSIKNLTPGPYRVAWKTASGAGELKVVLGERSTIHLSVSRAGKLGVDREAASR